MTYSLVRNSFNTVTAGFIMDSAGRTVRPMSTDEIRLVEDRRIAYR